MVSAGGGQQEGVRHRPHRQPVVRHPRRRGDLDQRRERRRVRADHHQLRLAGARARRQDHRRRSAHHAARPHLRPVPAGQARPRRRALHRHPAPDDRERLARPRLHRATTRSASSRSPSTCREWTPRADGRGDRHRRAGDPAGGRVVGHGEDQLPDARPRHRAPQQRRAERARRDQHRAGLGADRPAEAAATPRSPARATARAGASTARSATSCPAGATSPTPSTAPTSPASGASTRADLPQPGVDAYEMFRKIDRGEIKGLLSICFNPIVSLPDNDVRHAHAREAGVLRRHRLLPERDRPPRRHRAARLAARGGRGHRHAGRGPRHQDQQGGRPPGRGAPGLADHPGHRRRRSAAPQRLHLRRARARSSRSCASPPRAASPTTRASPTRRSSGSMGVFWPCPSDGPPRHAAAVRAGLVEPGRQGRRAVLLPRRQGALQRRRPTRRRPRTSTPSTRSS